MQTKIENITPEKATEYLKKNPANRQIRQAVVEQYALDMKKGHWLLNHQGIAFDAHNRLVDGQHRLEAIRMANVPVKLMVTTGLPSSVQNGMTIFTMDTVDRGKLRSVGDQLHLRHGCKSGNLYAAVCSVVSSVALNGQYVKLTVPACVQVLEIYRKEMDYAIANKENITGLRSATVIGAIAFALKSDSVKVKEFYELVTAGEGIHKSGPTSPAYALRKFILSNSFTAGGSTPGRWRSIAAVLNAARHFVNGEQIHQLKHTTLGVEYFINRQKSNVARITEIVSI